MKEVYRRIVSYIDVEVRYKKSDIRGTDFFNPDFADDADLFQRRDRKARRVSNFLCLISIFIHQHEKARRNLNTDFADYADS